MRNLKDLVAWLEYGRTSGYVAARESKEQEEAWADQLKVLLADIDALQEQVQRLTTVLPTSRYTWVKDCIDNILKRVP